MFGIGVPELILIALVTLVVVGPKNLPATLRAVGRAIREFQRATRELRREAGFDDVVDEVTRPLREGLSGIEEDMRKEAGEIEASVKKAYQARGVDTSMEYPEGGPDDYGALPEGAQVYPDSPQVLSEEEALAREARGPEPEPEAVAVGASQEGRAS